MNITSEKKLCKAEELGVNLFEGIVPEIKRLDGKDEELIIGITSPTSVPNAIMHLAERNFDYHVDIFTTAFELVYDLKKSIEIEQLYIVCHSIQSSYTIGELEVYVADDRDQLFNSKNKIIYCDNRERTQFPGGEQYAGILYNIDGVKCRYVGFVQRTNDVQCQVSRIAKFGAYNSEYTKTYEFINKNYSDSCIANTIPEIKGEYKGDVASLTNGTVCDEAFAADNTELKFTLPYCKKVDKLVVIGSNLGNVYYADDKSELKKVNYTKTDCSVCEEYVVDVSEFGATSTATVKLSGNINQIVMCCYSVDVKADFNEVITKDFWGIGGNSSPTHLFELGRMAGYNDAHLQLEKRRIAISNPSIVRLWFQIDWFVMDEADYYNRKYVFNSPKMQAVYKELDAYKENGVEIELCYAWKTGYSAMEWFGFNNVFNLNNAAPRDVNQCAISCVDILKELIVNRGYTNIKYFSYGNESNNGLPDGWDFVCPEGLHPMDHWLELLKKTNVILKAEGMDKYVDIWAAEIVGNNEKWAQFYSEKASDMYSLFCCHQYYAAYGFAKKIAEGLIKAAGDKPVGMTEYGTYVYGFSKYGRFVSNNIANTLGFINGGLTTMFYWMLNGTVIDEHFILNHTDENGHFWGMPTFDNPNPDASETYYGLTLFTNYIKRHSTVYKADSSDYGVHPAVIESPDGDITVFAEIMATDTEKTINIDFGKHIGKKFYKHFCPDVSKREPNLIIPPVVAQIDVDDKISDAVPAEYCMVVYTTIPPVKQVVMDNVYVTVEHGEEVKLNASVIDGDGTEGEIKWSIVDHNRLFGLKAEISEDGVFKSVGYHAPNRHSKGRPQFAVKAELPTGEYGITIVSITKDGK